MTYSILLAIARLINTFMPPNRIYTVASEIVRNPRRLTLNNAVSEEFGCAEAVSWILLNAGFNIPNGGIANVNGLIDWMLMNGFEEIQIPLAGAIITSHMAERSNPNHAHTGVCLHYGIGSNNSNNGLFQQNYTYQGWKAAFDSKGAKTRYFFHKN